MNSSPSAPPESTRAGERPTAERKENAYSRSRRSLRLWPVSREGNLKDLTVELFMVKELRLDQQYAVDIKFKVKRVNSPRQRDSSRPPQVKDEVLVLTPRTWRGRAGASDSKCRSNCGPVLGTYKIWAMSSSCGTRR